MLFFWPQRRKLNQSDQFIETIGFAAPMHDVGKIGIPDKILLKPGKLTTKEKGAHFDPGIIDIFLENFDTFVKIRNESGFLDQVSLDQVSLDQASLDQASLEKFKLSERDQICIQT